MTRKPTLKQKKFAKIYVETGNATEAAMQVYNLKDRVVAKSVGPENLAKPCVIKLIEDQASAAMIDQIEIREELKQSKKDYAVRSGVNKDILDRAGYKPPEKNLNMNVEFKMVVLTELNN